MDYANEEWIKVYTRDTASWRATSIGARGLTLELSRCMGRFTNEISLGARGLRAVAALVSASWEEIAPWLEELLRDGRLIYDEERQVLIDPVHLERQGAVTSAAMRKRIERKRGGGGGEGGGHAMSRDVTRSHAESRDVTPSHDQREEREEKERERDARARTHEDVRTEPEPETPPAPKAEPPRLTPLTLEEPLPDSWRSRAQGLAEAAGAPELDVATCWTNYVAWCVERSLRPNEGRWTRWCNDDIRRLKRDRVIDRERSSGPRLRMVDPPKPPYELAAKLAEPDKEPEVRVAKRRPLPPPDDAHRQAAARFARLFA